MSVTIDVLEYLKSHSKNDTYLYNNRLLFSRLITTEEYNNNHAFIKNGCSVTMN